MGNEKEKRKNEAESENEKKLNDTTKKKDSIKKQIIHKQSLMKKKDNIEKQIIDKQSLMKKENNKEQQSTSEEIEQLKKHLRQQIFQFKGELEKVQKEQKDKAWYEHAKRKKREKDLMNKEQ